MGKERRKFKRLPMHGFMDCAVEFQLDGKQHGHIPVLSISAGGMYIAINERTEFTLTKGDQLMEIQFSLDDLKSLVLKGTIAHRMSLGEIGGCGVEFFESQEEAVELLDSFVDQKLDEFGLQ